MIFSLTNSIINIKVRFWRIMFFRKHHHAIKHHTFVLVIYLLLLFFPCIVVSQSSNPSSSPLSPNDETTRTYKYSPAMTFVFVIIVVVFFVVGCFSVFAGQCIVSSGSPRSSLFMIQQVNRRSRRARNQGLEPNVIDTFPTFAYSDVKKVRIGKGDVELECSICLNEFKEEETLRLIPKCCHVFHPECIDTWLISHVTCPVCRADLIPVPSETGTDNCDLDSTRPTWLDEEHGQVHVEEIRETDVELDSSNSQRQRVEGKFPRSHSTGHSLFRPWNDHERFTLRLPQDVQKKLMKPVLVRAKSNLVLPSASSAKRGFRSSSVGPGLGLPIHNSYEQFEHEGRQDRWGFMVAPPFFTRSRSVQATIGGDNLNNVTKSGSSPEPTEISYDWLFGGTSSKDEAGERSFARLI